MGSLRPKRSRASTANTPDNENLSPISCEVCRQRKCKCDRKLPYCSQCSGEPSKCVYPESGKRGLPLGYLNQLEQRLAETQSALYGALVTLRSMRPTTVVQASTKPDSAQKQKAARMDEWSQLPLRGWPDMERWLAAMSDQFTIEQPQGLPFTDTSSGYRMPISPGQNVTHSPRVEVEAQGPSAIYTWQPREEIHMGSPYEAHLRLHVTRSSPVYSRGPGNAGPDGVASPAVGLPEYTNVTVAGESGHSRVSEGGESARAEELSKSKPSIYF